MEDVEKMVGGVMAIVLAVGSLIARYRATDPKKSVFDRLAVTFDLTQIFDSTRKIND